MKSEVTQWIAILLVLPSLIGLFYKSREVPLNYLLLGIFTLGESLAVASLAAQLDPMSVTIAITLFLMLTVCLFVASMFMQDCSNYGLTMFGAIIVACLVQLILIPLMFTTNTRSILLVSLLATVIFSAYVVIDLHLLATRISVDDYILGATMLYIDLLRLFIFILQIVGRRK